jgi:hypothetical protein
MEKKKIFIFLCQLGKPEWKAFESYLEHPMLGASELYVDFLAAFYQMHFGKQKMSEADFHFYVYGHRKLRTLHMNRHFSLMCDKLFDFLAYQAYKRNAALQLEARMLALADRGWSEAGDEVYAKGVAKLRENPIRSGASYLGLAKLSLLKKGTEPVPGPKARATFLEEPMRLLDEAYAIAALELATKACNYAPQNHDSLQMPRWLQPQLREADAPPVPALLATILHHIYQMYQHPAAAYQHFTQAQTLLDAALKHLQPENSVLFQELYSHLISHGGRNLQAEPARYRPALYQLYDSMLTHHLLLDDGLLSPIHLINVVERAWKVEPLERGIALLDLYQAQLPPNLKDATYQCCLALLHFHHTLYPAARQQLLQAEVAIGTADSFELNLSIKTHLLIMTVECGDYEAIAKMAANYRTWLKRHHGNPLPPRFAGYGSFAEGIEKIADHLLDLDSHGPKTDWPAECQALQAAWKLQKPIHHAWLLQKLR